MRIRDVYSGYLIQIFLHPGSRISGSGIENWNWKLIYFLTDIWVGDPRSGIRNPRSGIQNSRSGIRDPRSGIRDPRSGSWIRIQGSKKHQIPDPDPQHWWKAVTFSWELPPFMVRIFVSFSWECRIEIPWRQKKFYLKRAAKFN